MKFSRLTLIIIFLLILLVGGILIFESSSDRQTKEEVTINVDDKIGIMKLTSSEFSHNQAIPSKYTCDGENVNPPLAISGVPENTKSLALIMDDPDAPAGTWVHWTVWNINPEISGIGENETPSSASPFDEASRLDPGFASQGQTSFGKQGYGGPCPPSGTHRYFFKLYALDATLSLSQSAIKEDIEKAMEGHILDKSELIGLYSRK